MGLTYLGKVSRQNPVMCPRVNRMIISINILDITFTAQTFRTETVKISLTATMPAVYAQPTTLNLHHFQQKLVAAYFPHSKISHISIPLTSKVQNVDVALLQRSSTVRRARFYCLANRDQNRHHDFWSRIRG